MLVRMALVLVSVVLAIVTITFADAASRNSTCFTPNNEKANCVPVNSCKPILDAIVTKNSSALNFAKQSQCGYDNEPLVCCGSTGYPVSTLIFDIFTKPFPSSNGITPYGHSLLPDTSVCGLQKTDNKILGGQRTDLDEFPWLALLGYKDESGSDAGFKCGGSLINRRYVVTAAHCVSLNPNAGLNLAYVRLGEWRISTSKDCLEENNLKVCSEPVIDVRIQEVVPHPYYGRRSRDNDIALVRLTENIIYTDFIRPICIPSPNSLLADVGTNLIVAGWGSTENSSSSDVKLKVQVPLVSQTDCAQKLAQRTKVTDNQVCAGAIKGKDSCQGDSGGPLMRIVEDSGPPQFQWFLEGVISWGVGCGVPGFPGVYTRVSKYSSWIGNNLKGFD